ncbi:hypothetical protein OF83DRAFT_1175745 [Amylostereum chailletii]|nr:hypothetical protein OF83DRAFT_1175745 [Amylostereum chailletii]
MHLFRGRSHSDDGAAPEKSTPVAPPPRPPRSLSRPSTSSSSSVRSPQICPHPPPTLVHALYAPSDAPYTPIPTPSVVRAPSPVALHDLPPLPHPPPAPRIDLNIDLDPSWSPASQFSTPSTPFQLTTTLSESAPSEISGMTALASSMSIGKREPAELLTFAFGDSMAYVPSARTYDEAIAHALDAFPALHAYDRAHLALAVGGSSAGSSASVTDRARLGRVRVPRRAWAELVLDLRKYEVVHVLVDEDRPPSYKARRSGVVGWVKEVVKWKRRDGSRRIAMGPAVGDVRTFGPRGQ